MSTTLLTAQQTLEQYPVGTVVRFHGYEDQVGLDTATFRPRQLVEVVGHSTDCGADGLLVRRYYHGYSNRRGRKVGMVFVTEVGAGLVLS
tara:strand:+ start:515 stop:784 length:270 start_codon:yes stop_codon:yes gene_type:complete